MDNLRTVSNVDYRSINLFIITQSSCGAVFLKKIFTDKPIMGIMVEIMIVIVEHCDDNEE